MRVVWEESELERAYHAAKAEAAASFKNDGIYLEKYVEEPRHIEIQVAGDQYGRFVTLASGIAPFSAGIRSWWRSRLPLS